jgi:hypothetical protein
MSSESPRKQAVVIIHGIGEQRPMNTLRSFVEAALTERENDWKDSKNKKPLYRSKPDNLSDTFELRRLNYFPPQTESTNTCEINNKQPLETHFYEFYWSHLMPVAEWRKIYYLLRMFFLNDYREFKDVPVCFRIFRFMLRFLEVIRRVLPYALIILALLLLYTALFYDANLSIYSRYIYSRIATSWELIDDKMVAAIASAFLFVWGIIWLSLDYWIRSYIGDAATYLNPSPGNVAIRSSIRRAGVDLIHKLHEKNYDRIVIVGHSLGSVIGYDIITHAWQRYHASGVAPAQPQMDEAEKLSLNLAQLEPPKQDWKEWGAQSLKLWAERRELGCPWLVTDFITLGSPLTYGSILLADKNFDFKTRAEQYELPTCPPAMTVDTTGKLSFSFLNNNKVRVTHHAACFALTRWTNLYFPTSWCLKGDIVGGPVRQLFGNGIRDIPVKTRGSRSWFLHTHYWTLAPDGKLMPEDDSIQALRDALYLPPANFPNPAAKKDSA